MGQTQNIKQKWKVLVVNQTYTKMLNCFIRLFPRLSEKMFFALYAFNDDSNFYNSPIFSQK